MFCSLTACAFDFTGGIPPDGSPIHITRTYKPGVTVVFYVLALCGVIFSIVCFAFNLIFREKKYNSLLTSKQNMYMLQKNAIKFLYIGVVDNCAIFLLYDFSE